MALRSRHQPFAWRTLPSGAWPYVWSILLMLASSLFLWFGDQLTMRYALPWSLVSLIVVATSAVLWGVRPAVMVLVITAMFGDIVAPDLHISYFYGQPAPAPINLTRMLLYLICGATMVWLAHQARTMREKSEAKRLALHTMQALAAPARLADAPGWDVASLYLTARQDEEVGGDFYGFFRIDARFCGILLGDVMGKGKEAAAHTAMLRYTVRAYACEGHRPDTIVQRINDYMEADPDASTASMFYGVLDIDSGCVEYASAGHEPPMLIRADGSTETLAATGPLVGILSGIPFGQKREDVETGDRLLLVTDGVTEARNVDGVFLEDRGALDLLAACRAACARDTVKEFADAVMDFAGGDNRDDIAILLLRRECTKEIAPGRQPMAVSTVEAGR